MKNISLVVRLTFVSLMVANSSLGLGITPLEMMLVVPQSNGEVKVINDSDREVTVQAEVQKWKRDEFQDQLTETEDVEAAPAAFKIAPNGSQLVRIVRTKDALASSEENYRLIATEIPEKKLFIQKAGTIFAPGFSIPVHFVPADTKPDLTWQVEKIGKRLYARVNNKGSQHFSVVTLVGKAKNSGKDVKFEWTTGTRVFSGGAEAWVSEVIDSGFEPGGEITLEASNVRDRQKAQVTITKPTSVPVWKVMRTADRISVEFYTEGKEAWKLKTLSLVADANTAKRQEINLVRDNSKKVPISNKEVWTSNGDIQGFPKGRLVQIRTITSRGPLDEFASIE